MKLEDIFTDILGDKTVLIQFQTGISSLRIETGRYHSKKDPKTECFKKLNIEERTCFIRNTKDTEDETHIFENVLHMNFFFISIT